jgi:CD36 family
VLLPEGVNELKKVRPYINDVNESDGDEMTSYENENAKTLDVEYDDSVELSRHNFPSSEITKQFRLRDYAISLWNGSPFLPYWNVDGSVNQNPSVNECNAVRGDFDGFLLPKDISKRESFKFFRKSLCEHFFGDYEREGQFNGMHAYWYKIRDIADTLDNPNTRCFCENDLTSSGKCYKYGLGNVGKCYRGSSFSFKM